MKLIMGLYSDMRLLGPFCALTFNPVTFNPNIFTVTLCLGVFVYVNDKKQNDTDTTKIHILQFTVIHILRSL